MDLCHILLNKSNGATFHRLKVEDNTCHFLSLEKNLLLGLYTSPLNLPKRRNQELQVLDDKSRQKRRAATLMTLVILLQFIFTFCTNFGQLVLARKFKLIYGFFFVKILRFPP